MNFKVRSILACVLGLLFFVPVSAFAVPCKNVLIYYTSWSKYNSPAYNFSSIPYSKISHICYAFITPNADGSLNVATDYMGADGVHYDGVSMIAAAHAAGVKVLLSCGGAGSVVDGNYTTIAASTTTINTFATNLKNYCQTYGFDGVDIDWEFPNTNAKSTEYDSLLSGIRSVMPSPTWLLTAALSADSYEPTFLHISTINNYLSFFNLMCYDYHGSWLTHSGDNAALFEDSADPAFGHTASGTWAVNYYTSNGATASKINYGLPFYGYGFNTAALYQNCGGNCTTTTLTYAQIAPLVGVGWTRNWDSSSDSPNITYNSGVSVISYDDSQSVSIKTNYVINTLGVAGVFAWSADQDYNGSTQPLLDAMYNVASAGCAPTNTPTVTSTSTNSPTITNTPTPVVSSTWRVNAGGPNYTDSLGNLWVADTNYSGGTGATGGTVTGTSDPTLYGTQRYGTNFTYTFSVPAGSYQVTLKFAETYGGDYRAGARVFNVLVNGATAVPNLDVWAKGGPSTAYDVVLDNIAPSGGTITIQFTGTTSSDTNAVVEALQILPEPTTPTPTRTGTPTSSFTVASTSTRTSTLTSTSTVTLTATLTVTETNTTLPNTATATSISTSTQTNTSTPLAETATSTATSTSSMTPTSTQTGTVTSTQTGTSTPLADTATPTLTNTSTSTSSPTNANTLASTSTCTSTSISTNTQTATVTVTASRTATVAMTSTFTGVSTNTFTPTSTSTATASLTMTGTNSSTPIPTKPHTNTPTVTYTPTATATTLGCGGAPLWNGNFVAYAIDQKVSYKGEIYQCIQSHTSEPNWMPSVVPALWKDLGPCGLVATPTGPGSIVVYPNPVTGDTANISLPSSGNATVTVEIFTIAMRVVQTIKAPQPPDAVLPVKLYDKMGMRLANGLYYFRVHVGDQSWVTKVLVLR